MPNTSTSVPIQPISANLLAALASCLIVALPLPALAGKGVEVRETYREMTTYPFSDPDPVADPRAPIYPYFRFDGFTNKPVKKKWKVVELENDYIKLTIMPEIGGKIWSAIDKKTGKPFIYENGVVKFRDIAMRGPWTSGGIESNFGIMGHAPSTSSPVDYAVVKKPDGSVSCVIGTLDLLTQSRWRVDINLPKDKAYFTTSPTWQNTTPREEPYYMWMNAGIKVAGKLQYEFSGQSFLGHDGDSNAWPRASQNGKDISQYEQNDFGGYKSYHVFGKYSEYFGAYWMNEDFGMGHYAPRGDVVGRKIWIWGLSQQGMIWERMLTDSTGQYSEIQSGRLFNQTSVKSTFTPFKHKGFAPYSTDSWSEYWFPVSRIKGYVKVNNYGALNLTRDGGQPKVYFYALQQIDDELRVSLGGKTIYTRALHLKPGEVFSDQLPEAAASQEPAVTLGGSKLVYDPAPEANVLARPVDAPVDFDWNTAYGLYLQGKEHSRARNYVQAEEKINASLKKDPNFLPSLVELAALQYRALRYDAALATVRRALAIDTYDAAANFNYGLINRQLGKRADAMDGFDIAALDPAYRGAAMTERAKMHLQAGDPLNALDYAQRALVSNQHNLEAMQVLAAVYRLRGDEAQASKVLKTVLELDPLSHFAHAEQYLWHPGAATQSRLESFVRNEFPEQTYVELADWYWQNGLRDSALKMLSIAPRGAEVMYREAYLADKPLDLKRIDFHDVRPFRAETRDILVGLIAKNDDWRLKYHLALIEWFRNNVDEAKRLFQQIGDRPDVAAFYASRAKLFTENADADLEKARQLDPEQWRYVKALGDRYLERGANERALAIVEPFYRRHPSYILGMQYGKALIRNGRFAEADALFATLDIIPFEGATEGVVLHRESKLMQAAKAIQQRQFDLALKMIDAAREWPLNLGVGKGYAPDVDERLEDWMSYVSLRGLGDEAKASEKLAKVLAFMPKVENTVRNFEPANQVVSAWALDAAGKKAEAAQVIKGWQSKEPEEGLYRWCLAVYEHNRPSEENGAANNSMARVVNELLRAQ